MDLPLQSIFDRLMDDDPEGGPEQTPSRQEIIERIKHGVRRDLEELLNTRYRVVSWPIDFDQLDDSLINYGIPDFTSASLDASENEQFLLDAIKKAIELFEPRLSGVQVSQVGERHSIDRTFYFRIQATLIIAPDEIPVKFDTSVESATGQFAVNWDM